MPLVSRLVGGCSLLALFASPATGQEIGGDRFFAEEKVSEEAPTTTAFDGSLTSTTFYYREDGDLAPPVGDTAPFAASPVDRIFTDLRAQMHAKHIGGSRAAVRADLRGRFNTTTFTTPSGAEADGQNEVPYQSGTFHGNELDVRELYGRRDGDSVDISVGRQYSLELAATKFDGLKIEVGSTPRWKYILFGGLYPSRISRDLRDDYAYGDSDPETPGYQEGGALVLPVTGGTGMAYRFQGGYGALGVVGILPVGDDLNTGEAEPARVFATSNGYWRASQKVDFYHYLVADAAGAGGAGLTNLTLGLNLQPTTSLVAYASVTRIDTDTLNVIAQTKLADPDDNVGPNQLQNNIEVQRIAQDSARVGLSARFNDRVELSTSGTLRRRGELQLATVMGLGQEDGEVVTFPAAQAADVTIGLVDRKSIADMRLGLTGTASFGVGDAKLYRSTSYVARADATKELADGRADLEINVTYLSSTDDGRGAQCMASDILTCYGASSVQSVTLGVLGFWRFSPSWFALAGGVVGPQFGDSASATGEPVEQPTILVSNFLLRLAYRF
jgi:hypothetical protein